MIEITTQQELQEQLSRNGKVVALFYASWCPFCRSFLPIFTKYPPQDNSAVWIRVRIDEDENPLWEEYSFEAVPAVIFYEKEQVAKRLDCRLGRGLNESQFRDWLKTL
jgi:thioredoxin 1